MTLNNENPGGDQETMHCIEVVVANEHGLHARPAGKLAQQAQAFEAQIAIVHEGQEVDAKSILDVLTLAAGPGDKLEIRATGCDAKQATDAIHALFKNKFDE